MTTSLISCNRVPAHSLNMLSLGDSYTICETLTPEERWPNVLANDLHAKKLEVGDPTIIARTGWTTDELNNAIDAQNPSTNSFDLVTLLIGVNNQYRGRSIESFRPEFAALLKRSIAFTRANNPKHVIVVSIPDWGVMPFAEGKDRAKIAGEIDAFNDVCREEAKTAGAVFVDITPISREAATDASLVAVDGLHPSAKQYKRWIEEKLAAATSDALSATNTK